MKVKPVSSVSLNFVAIQTETGGLSTEFKHNGKFENSPSNNPTP